eukprot:gene4765-biopygen88
MNPKNQKDAIASFSDCEAEEGTTRVKAEDSRGSLGGEDSDLVGEAEDPCGAGAAEPLERRWEEEEEDEKRVRTRFSDIACACWAMAVSMRCFSADDREEREESTGGGERTEPTEF